MRDTFGQRLQEARERVGCSQRGLGVRMGLPPKQASVYVNRWERQGKQPSWEAIDKMAQVLAVPPAFFLADNTLLAEVILLAGTKDRERLQALLETLQEEENRKSDP